MSRLSHHTTPPRHLEAILSEHAALGRDRVVEPWIGGLVRALAASKPGGAFLHAGGAELAAWLMDGMDITTRLVTIPGDPAQREVTTRHLGDDIRLAVHSQDPLDFLRDVARHRFHFIAFDEAPGDIALLEAAAGLLAPGALLLINALPAGDAAAAPVAAFLHGQPGLHVGWLPHSTGAVLAVRSPERAGPRRGRRRGAREPARARRTAEVGSG